MSIHRVQEGVYKIRWREGGRNKSKIVHGSRGLAEKIERKKLSLRDEGRHLDIKREVNFRMSALIEGYWNQYGQAGIHFYDNPVLRPKSLSRRLT